MVGKEFPKYMLAEESSGTCQENMASRKIAFS
jgi:hypothetical protein